MPAGAVTTLGRGGSDLTATVLGAALELPEVQVWKDVDGEWAEGWGWWRLGRGGGVAGRGRRTEGSDGLGCIWMDGGRAGRGRGPM